MLVDKALEGDVAAAKLLFERLFGPPVASDVLERIAELEAVLGGELRELRELREGVN